MLRRIFLVVGVLLATMSWLAPARAVDDQNCEDFVSQAAAQAHLRQDPTDPDQLDPDKDGIACSITAYTNTARDTNPVGQVAVTITSVRNGAITTTTTVTVLPTTVAQTGAFSIPLFGAGIILVGIGMSFRGKRPDGSYFRNS